jgi:hypothetical protein
MSTQTIIHIIDVAMIFVIAVTWGRSRTRATHSENRRDAEDRDDA